MSLLQESVNALTAAAGWKKASPGADGVFRFRLEGDLDMEFFSPDGRTGILRADLGPLPRRGTGCGRALAEVRLPCGGGRTYPEDGPFGG